MPLEVELSLRLLLAAILAGAIGLEREVRDHPAGFRTHMLVSVGACLFALISAYGALAFAESRPGVDIRVDPTRMAAQIVTGIGFLGAGAIIRSGMSVRGLTTAASLWVVAAIGTAVGFGAYLLASVATTVTLLALLLLRPVRTRLVRGLKREHEEFVVQARPELRLDRLIAGVVEGGMRVEHVRVEEEEPGGEREIVLVLTVPANHRPEETVGVIAGISGVRHVEWNR